ADPLDQAVCDADHGKGFCAVLEADRHGGGDWVKCKPPLPMTPHARHGLPPAYLVEIDRLPDVALLERYAIEYGCRHPALLALVDDLRCSNPPRVRNDRRAARGQRSVEYPGDEAGVWLLVQHVRRDDKLEAPDVMRKAPPVADARVDQRPGV